MQKGKSIGRNILIVVLILVTIASVCAGLYAWAKYQTTINGTATGETAKWSFKVSDGNTSTQEIEFPMTRTDNNTSVAEGKIAPGTFGELEIGIDATGTETALTYVIEGTTENLPTNLKFYSDEERTLELTVLDNKFSKGGYMKLNEVGERTEKIYWEWPFETGTCPIITDEKLADLEINKTEFDALINEKKFTEANDMLDTAESSIQVSMKVSVTGKQLNGEPRLADLVQVGDYVNYNASSNGVKTFTSADWLAGSRVLKSEGEDFVETELSTNEEFNSSAKAQWRVLSVDRNTGKVELMSTEPTEKVVELSGGNGFINAKTALNNIGAIYGHGKGAVKGKSITLEDIEEYSNYNPYSFVSKYSNTGLYNGKREYTSGNFYVEKYENGKIVEYESTTTPAPVTMTETAYYYVPLNYIKNSVIYDMFFKNSVNTSNNKSNYWLASQCVNLHEVTCSFRVYRIYSKGIYTYDLYNSAGRNSTEKYSIVPVVELQTNIQTAGQDVNGVWQLDV